MSYRNKTERIPQINNNINSKNENEKNSKKYNSSVNHDKIFGKISPLKKSNNQMSKVILKGKLFSLINKSNIMTEEQFNDIKIRLSLAQLEKYKITKKNIKKQFYYAQQNPNILHPLKNPNKFEDDYINMRELLKKFSQKEQDEILSFPQFFQLNSNEFLKELVEERHKNLYEIITNEENKEIELKNFKIKQREELNSYKNNYNKTRHNRNRNILLKKEESEEGSSSNNINLNKINKTNSNNSYKNKSKKNIFDIKKKFLSRNFDDKKIIKEFKTYNNNFINNLNINENKKFIDANFYNKNKMTNKEMKSKMNEKYEKLKKRKELMILDKQKKMEEIKKRNIKEQSKKEKERQKIYEEKKFIDYISNILKKNYTLKEEKLKNMKEIKEKKEQKEQIEKNDLKEKEIISSFGSFENERKFSNISGYK